MEAYFQHLNIRMVSHDIILTEEMIFDFFNNTKLDHLDLSRNNFICSEQVAHDQNYQD